LNTDIRAIDNFLPEDHFNKVLTYCRSAAYLYGETDEIETTETVALKYVPLS